MSATEGDIPVSEAEAFCILSLSLALKRGATLTPAAGECG